MPTAAGPDFDHVITMLWRDTMRRQELFSICDEGSDKASAMNVAGYATDFLRQLLETKMIKDDAVGELFDGYAPLATFFARIRVAFALGLIDAQTEKDLDYIRKIRNVFAHSKEPISFDESPVRELRQQLSTAKEHEDQDRGSRWKYMSAAVAVLGRLYNLVEKSSAGQ